MTMRADGLSYFGECTVRLYGIDYPMKFDNHTLNQWERETGKDFAHLSMEVVLAWTHLLQQRHAAAKAKASGDVTVKYNIAEEAAKLTGVVSKSDAAWLFFIGAKAMNTQVSFEEIQEGVMLDGAYRRKVVDPEHPDYSPDDDKGYTESYPILFVSVVLALQEAYKTIKKKPAIRASS